MRITVVITARPSYARVQTALTALRSCGTEVSIVCVASALLPKYGEVSTQIAASGNRQIRRFARSMNRAGSPRRR